MSEKIEPRECPICQCRLDVEIEQEAWRHKDSECFFAGYGVTDIDLPKWNTRTPSKLTKELAEALSAAKRLLDNNYRSWESSGGPEQCIHGYASGIDCPSCDFIKLNAALSNLKQEGVL